MNIVFRSEQIEAFLTLQGFNDDCFAWAQFSKTINKLSIWTLTLRDDLWNGLFVTSE